MKYARWISTCFAFLLFVAGSTIAQAVTISRFTPSNAEAGLEQVTAEFSKPVITLGDAQLPSPFDVRCSIPGTSVWLDNQRWAYNFSKPLPPGTSCDFSLRPDFKPINNQPITGKQQFIINTGGPTPERIWPSEYNSVEEDQVFALQLNGPVNVASVREHAWCEINSVQEKIPVQIIEGDVRQHILSALFKKEDPDKLVFLKCSRALPPGAKMQLVWGAGITSPTDAKIATRQAIDYIYSVRKPFTIKMSCDRLYAKAACIPLRPVRLFFSESVSSDLAKRITLKTSKGVRKPNPLTDSETTSIEFSPPFDPDTTLEVVLPNEFKDISGRPLASTQSLPIQIQFSAIPPLAKFSGNFGILEAGNTPMLPVTLRNVESLKDTQSALKVREIQLTSTTPDKNLRAWYEKSIQFDATSDANQKNPQTYSLLSDIAGHASFDLDKPNGSKATETVGIPLKSPGLYIVELESKLLGKAYFGKNAPMYVRTAALVTDMAVHFKYSNKNALIWVTSLSTGNPVPDAAVAVLDCNGNTLWNGETNIDGIAYIDQPPSEESQSQCGNYNYFITARKNGDVSFVSSNWNDGIEPWRFNLPGEWDNPGPRTVHAVFDVTLLKPEQKVSMKLFARDRVMLKGLAIPNKNTLPVTATITHIASDESVELPIQWDTLGSALLSYTLPKTAKLGAYSVNVGQLNAGQFYVTDFRLPVMTGTVKPLIDKFTNNTLPVQLQLNYLSGSPAGDYLVRLSGSIEPKYLSFEEFSDYNFNFDEEDLKSTIASSDDDSDANSSPNKPVMIADKMQIRLDANGSSQVQITKIPSFISPQTLTLEMTFRDPDGQAVAIPSQSTLWPSDVAVGITAKQKQSDTPAADIKIITLDTKGKRESNVAVSVTAYQSIWYSHRKRVVGGLYAYENRKEVKRLGEVCNGRTDQNGQFTCSPLINGEGNIILVADATDGRGQISHADYSMWIDTDKSWYAAGNSDDRIDIIPEKKSYEAGEKAVFQVVMPFRKATALIAVERDGILATYVKTLSGSKPTFEIPVISTYTPNVYVSVLAVRERLESIPWYSFFTWGWRSPIEWFKAWWNQPDENTGTVDLAKPAFKFGVTEITVGEKSHALNVSVTADRTAYHVGDVARVIVEVKTPDGKPAPAGTEIAFAAVDKALLELKPNTSWNLLQAMYPHQGYEVKTSTAQMRVIGKRHFGRKAAAPGGGGGMPTDSLTRIRDNFNPLLLWAPKMTLGADGKVVVDVKLNDSLTTFALVAVSSTGANNFGTGQTEIKSVQDLQLFSTVPTVVREGDQIITGGTLHNATDKPMNVTINGTVNIDGTVRQLPVKNIALPANGTREVGWTLDIPLNAQEIIWEINALEPQRKLSDAIQVSQSVQPVTRVSVRQAMLTQLDTPKSFEVINPVGAIENRSSINVGLSVSLLDSLDPLKRYFNEYPFNCLEQRVAIAVGLNDKTKWDKIVQTLPEYIDNQGLLRYFPTDRIEGSVILTAHVLSIAHEAGFDIPKADRLRLIEALQSFAEGRLKLQYAIPANDSVSVRLMAIAALARYNEAKSSMLDSVSVNVAKWPTSTLLDWINILTRVQNISNRSTKLSQAMDALRGRIIEQGTRTMFSGEENDYQWWLMSSPDTNAVRMILTVMNQPDWKESLPRLFMGTLARQEKGIWGTTVANAWGSLMVRKFANQFDGPQPTGQTVATLNDVSNKFIWNGQRQGSVSLDWGTVKAGEKGKFSLQQNGNGKPWAIIQSLAAVPITEPVFSGLQITKEIQPVEQKQKGLWSIGDIMRVKVTIKSSSNNGWVAMSDPIPAGAQILGGGLGRDKVIGNTGTQTTGTAPVFDERRTDRYDMYFDNFPKGTVTVEYLVQLNTAGRFALPATRVEALYAPETFAETPNATLSVAQ